MTDQDECRRAFEDRYSSLDLRRAPTGEYLDSYYTGYLWQGWKACWNRHEQDRKDATSFLSTLSRKYAGEAPQSMLDEIWVAIAKDRETK